jgi:hypothetical protein
MSDCYLFISHHIFIYLFIYSFEELYALYPSPNIIRVINPSRRWAWHVASMGDRSCVYRVWWGDVKKRDHLEDLGLDGRTLKCICKKWDVVGAWTGLICLRIGTGGGHL